MYDHDTYDTVPYEHTNKMKGPSHSQLLPTPTQSSSKILGTKGPNNFGHGSPMTVTIRYDTRTNKDLSNRPELGPSMVELVQRIPPPDPLILMFRMAWILD